MRAALALSVASLLWLIDPAVAHARGTFTFQRNPLNTYLLHPASPVAMPMVIDLATINAAPGDCLEFTVNGSFQCQMPGNPACVSKSTGVVFSSTNVVLAQNQPNRVPGAIDAGLYVVTGPLCGPNGTAPSDIPFDFRVDPTGLAKVPVGAAFLIVGTPDCYNSDNLDNDGDFQLVINVIHHVPCPGDIAPLICRDNLVAVDDLLAVINAWGPCPPGNDCPADINADGTVDVIDLLAVINAWGPCA